MKQNKLDPRDKVYNIIILINELKYQPHTYGTILQEFSDCKTLNRVLRRKLKPYHQRGKILKCHIPGKGLGEVLYYHELRDYHILFTSDRLGIKVYYFDDYKKISRNIIELKTYYLLKNNEWKYHMKSKRIFSGDVLKWF